MIAAHVSRLSPIAGTDGPEYSLGFEPRGAHSEAQRRLSDTIFRLRSR